MNPAAYAVVKGDKVIPYGSKAEADTVASRFGGEVKALYLPDAGALNNTASTLRTWAEAGEAITLSPEWFQNIAAEIYLLESVVLSQDQDLAYYRERISRLQHELQCTDQRKTG